MDDTLQRIAALYDSLYWVSPLLNKDLGKVEPPANFKITGFKAYADGSTWNPGNGAGEYTWNGSSWIPNWTSSNDGSGSGLDADTLDTKHYSDLYFGPTTQSNVTASRVLGNVYQNTTGKPMWVRVIATSTVQHTLDGYADASNPPTTVKDTEGGASTDVAGVGFWVYPNHYYKVTVSAGTPTLNLWFEEY